MENPDSWKNNFLLPSDKKNVLLSDKPSKARIDLEGIKIVLQCVCPRGVSFSSAPSISIDLKAKNAPAFIRKDTFNLLSVIFKLSVQTEQTKDH